MSPVAVSADRRFHRAQVKPSRRRGLWRSAIVILAKCAAVVAVVASAVTRGTVFLAESPLLGITRIEATGNHHVSSDEVRRLLDGLKGENILHADLGAWRTKLLESPWVRDASFQRSLPSTIDVVVEERTPTAIGRMGGQLFLIDELGRPIDLFGPQYSTLELPIVDGFSRSDAEKSANEARAAVAARLIRSIRQKPAIAKRLSQVDVSDAHNVSVLLNDDPAELRLGDDRFLERLESYLSLASALRERIPDIDYVDMRFDGRVYVRPVGKPGRSGAAGSPARPSLNRVNSAAPR
jgi:cell division protein FtsQ